MRLAEIRIRDPFILPIPEERKYYMYGTTSFGDPGCPWGFDAWVSTDLEEWSGPIPVFRSPQGFWADRQFWAPEVYRYQGRYYMFATFNSLKRNGGTQVLVADDPWGPFLPHSDGPVTPADFVALDGTLFIDGVPWMVFCREWIQVHDGEIWAMPLTRDLKAAAGEPQLLFSASSAPWSRVKEDQQNFVTDGPFLLRTEGKALLMLWSSCTPEGYALGVAVSESGSVLGPWFHVSEPLYNANGGHGMVFSTFEGELLLSLHSPNNKPYERAHFLPVAIEGETIRLR